MNAKALGDQPVNAWGEHGAVLGGITLRQHFAGLAMQGLASVPLQGESPDSAVRSDARRAVAYADALLAELAKAQP